MGLVGCEIPDSAMRPVVIALLEPPVLVCASPTDLEESTAESVFMSLNRPDDIGGCTSGSNRGHYKIDNCDIRPLSFVGDKNLWP
jgi:hypothetical protein